MFLSFAEFCISSPKEEAESLKETVALLSHPDRLEKLRLAQKRMAEGKGILLEKVTQAF